MGPNEINILITASFQCPFVVNINRQAPSLPLIINFVDNISYTAIKNPRAIRTFLRGPGMRIPSFPSKSALRRTGTRPRGTSAAAAASSARVTTATADRWSVSTGESSGRRGWRRRRTRRSRTSTASSRACCWWDLISVRFLFYSSTYCKAQLFKRNYFWAWLYNAN